MTAKLRILLSVIFAVICSVAVGAFAACGIIMGGNDDGTDDGTGGGDCEHSLVYHAAVKPNCLEEGNVEYWQCENCNLYFSDALAQTETTLKDVAIAALDHDLVGTVCEGIECTRGDYQADGVGHDFTGVEWIYADDLQMIDDHCTYEGTRSAVCNVCENTVSEPYRLENNHTYITEIGRQATCTEAGTIVTKCLVCGDVIATRSYADDNAHYWNDGQKQGSVTVYTCNHNANHTKRVIVADEGIAEASFTKDALAEVDEISISNTSISFDSAAMESLPADQEVKLSVEVADNSALDSTIREKITNEVYDINLTSTGGDITSFGGGKAKISLPYTLKAGEDLDTIIVWYVNGSTLEPIESTYSNGYVIFETTHFSLYTVGNYTAEEACEALGHNEVTRRIEPTCTADGVEEIFCSRCGEVLSKTILPANGHDYKKEVIDPTCTEQGYTIYTCSVCGDTYNDDYIEALGHEWNIPEPTCGEGQVCIRCDALGEPATGDHSYEDGKCTVCGQFDVDHHWSIIQNIAPTCTQYGYKHYICTDADCNYEYTLIIAPHGHIFDEPDREGLSDSCVYCGEGAPEDNVIVLEAVAFTSEYFDQYHTAGVWEREAVGDISYSFALMFYVDGHTVTYPVNATPSDYTIEYVIPLEALGSLPRAYGITLNDQAFYNAYNASIELRNQGCYVGLCVTVAASNGSASIVLTDNYVSKHQLQYSVELSIDREDVGCGEIYKYVYVCDICGYVEENAYVRQHAYKEIPELAPDSVTCFDGVIYKDTCTNCGEVRGERWVEAPTSHVSVLVTYKFETPCGIKTLTQFVCVCGGHKGNVSGLFNNNNGCYYTKQYEDYDDDGHKFEHYLCLECGSTMVVESYILADGCDRQSYIFYYFYTAEDEEMTDPINYYSSYIDHTFEEEVLENITYNYDIDGHGGEYRRTQYHCAVCGFEYYIINDYYSDEYGRSVYSYYETTYNGYMEWQKRQTSYGEHCESTEWEWTNEYPEGRPVDAPEGGSHVFKDGVYVNATCTQYGGYWAYECKACGYVEISGYPELMNGGHWFYNGVCGQCGALESEQGDAWNIRLEHLTIDEFGNSDYTYIGIFAAGVSVEQLTFTFNLVFLDENGKEILVPFSFDTDLKVRTLYPSTGYEWQVTGSYYLQIPNALLEAAKALSGYQNYLGLRITVNGGYIQSVLTVTDHRHQYEQGVCSICGYHCSHIYYESSICEACGEECKHQNHTTGGWCEECRAEVKHNFADGVCEDCGYVCTHQMEIMKDDQGRVYYVCYTCGLECYHDGTWGNVYGEGRCDICGAVCDHRYYETGDSAFNSEYVCEICGLICHHTNHAWEGYCTVCGKQVGHTWNNGECEGCGRICYHEFNGNTCTICGLYCEHEWDSQNGVCLNCGHHCRHDMNDGQCSICGFTCDHVDEMGNSAFADGHCYICGQECEHSWEHIEGQYAGHCTICNMWCYHHYLTSEFKDGKCVICGYECHHPDMWENGFCQICGTPCEHSWVYPPEDRFPEMDISSFCEICYEWCYHNDGRGNTFFDDNDNCTECGYHCEHEWQDGRCLYCGTWCAHKNAYYCYCPTCGSTLNQHIYDTTGKCFECGNVCEHKFGGGADMSVCDYCGYICYHEEVSYEYYIDPWTGEHMPNPEPMYGHFCLTCGWDAGQIPHRYKNGECVDCGYVCRHTDGLWDIDDDGTAEFCPICQIGCDHENHYQDGWCYECGTQAKHIFNDDNTCTVCGYHCEHTNHNYAGYCTECGEHVEHSFEKNYLGNVLCTECGYTCHHVMEDFANGDNCSICGEACPHYFNDNSTCRVCGYECEHDWNGYGLCNICHKTCNHPDHTIDGICSVCYGVAPHGPFTNGVCDVCGYECEHEFLPEGFCRRCQIECDHSYNSNGYCDICGRAQDGHKHEYNENGNGVCRICSYECRHPIYNEYGYCLDCNAECEHNWLFNFENSHNSYCSICGKWCYHSPYNGKWNDTTCTECGWTCTHFYEYSYSDEYHFCYICNHSEEHNFDTNGYCSECEYYCQHNLGFKDGKCSMCGWECTHSWQAYDNSQHRCDICGSYAKHNFEGSGWDISCADCGRNCDHSFDNGVCKNCDMICIHEWMYNTDGTHYCIICAKVEDHSFNNGKCTVCSWQCPHYNEDENGACTNCGLKCDHEWEPDGGSYGYHVCSICGRVTQHTYNASGECTLCHFQCDHPEGFMEGSRCGYCGMECPHNWQSSGGNYEHYCTICYLFEQHTYDKNGYCSACKWQCTHSWTDEGYCMECDAQCNHQWSSNADIDGHYCSICNYRESHKYDNGVCIYCEYKCEHPHGWDEGVCGVCGYGCPHDEWVYESAGEHICKTCRITEFHSFDQNGYCATCKWQCTHDGGSWQYLNDGEHICLICQKFEAHSFNKNGYCSTCDWQCYHANGFNDNSECEICGYECQHELFTDGECSTCGWNCPHDQWMYSTDSEHMCARCMTVQNHSFDKNGYCSTCEWQCNHSWGYDEYNHYCSNCGLNEAHNFNSEGVCDECYWRCAHHFGEFDENDRCPICSWQCYHDWRQQTEYIHYCDVCQKEEKHDWDTNGYCSTCGWQCDHYGNLFHCDICGYECPHNGGWHYQSSDHLCTICGASFPHEFVDSRCEICNRTCTHSYFVDGNCFYCGWECDHSSGWVFANNDYQNHYCKLCQATQSHNWQNGGCFGCLYGCMHENGFIDGKCVNCGWICDHSFWVMQNDEYTHICGFCEQYVKHEFDGEGYCYRCDWRCNHEYGFKEDGSCSVCGWQHYHEWHNDGNEYTHYCEICQREEKHDWDKNGYCSTCSWQCPHGNIFHCDICGYDCPHEWGKQERQSDQHYCQLCGDSEPHNYVSVDGKMRCSVCGWYCIHKQYDWSEEYFFMEGKCFFCGWECDHSSGWEYGGNFEHYCKMCKIPQSHNWNNGYCSDCYFSCEHPDGTYGGSCNICGWTCEHSWMQHDEYEHICGMCEQREKHELDGSGYCYKCSWSCEHSFGFDESGRCVICGWQHYHEWSFENEYAHFCGECTQSAKHKFDAQGYCYECAWWCNHEFGFDESGACMICGYKCGHVGGWMPFDEDYHQCQTCWAYFPHKWDESGNCTNCWASCNHMWERADDNNHYCIKCGTKEPHMYNWEGYCEMCWAECPHDWYTDLYMHGCNLCQRNEPHNFDWQGHCDICDYQCEHMSMDEWGWCPDCGQSVFYSIKEEVAILPSSKQN